jgi:hypothetical protein
MSSMKVMPKAAMPHRPVRLRLMRLLNSII